MPGNGRKAHQCGHRPVRVGSSLLFLFLEALSDGAVQAGLPRDVALKLAAATMRGAATMMLDLKRHPGQLKDMVTSRSGTTIEGIAALESRGFRSAVIEAVSAAFRRAETLGQGLTSADDSLTFIFSSS